MLFNLIKFALHFDPFNLGGFDPRVIDFLREDRVSPVHALQPGNQPAESRSDQSEQNPEDDREAA